MRPHLHQGQRSGGEDGDAAPAPEEAHLPSILRQRERERAVPRTGGRRGRTKGGQGRSSPVPLGGDWTFFVANRTTGIYTAELRLLLSCPSADRVRAGRAVAPATSRRKKQLKKNDGNFAASCSLSFFPLRVRISDLATCL